MNRGNIPGYYYDTELNKYFKIQPEHQLPAGAKYARQILKKENRSAKKRKIEHDALVQREKRKAIRESPALKYALAGGIGLEREQGVHPKISRRMLRYETATVAQWKPEKLKIEVPRRTYGPGVLLGASYVPELEQMLLAETCQTYTTSWLASHSMQYNDTSDEDSPSIAATSSRMVAGFHSAISSVSTGMHGDTARVVVCARRHQTGNVYLGVLPHHSDEAHEYFLTAEMFFTLGEAGSFLNDSAMHPTSGNAAIIGSSGIFIIDADAKLMNMKRVPAQHRDWPRCEPCINWLDINTVLYAAKADRGYSVMLWDVRTPDGRASRFNVRERLTSVLNPTKHATFGLGDEHQILASTQRRIDLFDTRMPKIRSQDPPVLSFDHIHGGPKLHSAAYGHLVAAVDAEDDIQMYSIRTGTKVESLAPPEGKPELYESRRYRQLKWYDDPWRGPALQTVRGNVITRWVWGGGGGDEE